MGEWAYPKDKLSVVIFMTDSYIKALRDKGGKGPKSLMVTRTYALRAKMKKNHFSRSQMDVSHYTTVSKAVLVKNLHSDFSLKHRPRLSPNLTLAA